MPHRRLFSATIRVAAALAPLAVMAACALLPSAARAGVANAGIAGASPADPLAGLPWGNYSGAQDEVFPSYRQAQGAARALLADVALRPRMRWFGYWYADDNAGHTASAYIANATGGNPNVLAQIAVFRLVPWEGEACKRLPTPAEQASYRTWILSFAHGIGDSRVALVLQPDLPFAFCVPGHSRLPLQLVAWAARVFSALPHTTVYIDAGAGDWAGIVQASWMLRMAGVRYTRGFALNATHYDTTANEIHWGARLVRALARAGVHGMHFVINTSSNGRGFTFQQYNDPHTFDNARVCRTRTDRLCAALGIPPTTQVASRRWGLPASDRRLAARYVDAYLWIGRPWLYNQATPFDLNRTVLLAASSPF